MANDKDKGNGDDYEAFEVSKKVVSFVAPLPEAEKTVNVSDLITLEVQEDKQTRPSISLQTLVAARAGGRQSAFDECRRTCEYQALSWRRGVVLGAMLSVITICITVALYYGLKKLF